MSLIDKVETIFLACARAAHEANRAYCIAIGDLSQVAWESAEKWQVDSAIAGVRGVLVDKNTPEESHETWVQQKVNDGWIHGPVKDPAHKEHPCIVPYSKLPSTQKRKDEIFVEVVWAIALALGWNAESGRFGAPEGVDGNGGTLMGKRPPPLAGQAGGLNQMRAGDIAALIAPVLEEMQSEMDRPGR